MVASRSSKPAVRRNPIAAMRADAQHGDKLTLCLAIFGWICYLVAALMASITVYMLVHNSNVSKSIGDGIVQKVESWPAVDKQAFYNKAKAYNASLDATHKGRIPADGRDSDGVPFESRDGAYMGTMNVDGAGGMARLRIPKVSISVPVLHTTLDESLDKGAGHFYGTDIPIGEKGSFTALGAHSGGVQGMLFTRLPQLKQHDTFYLDVLGAEHGYLIEDIRTIEPKDMEKTLQMIDKTIKPDQARVTLVTCVPIGVSTHRLLLTGVKGEIPDPVPPSYMQKDNMVLALWLAAAVFVLLIVMAIVWRIVRRKMAYKQRQRDA